MISHINATSVVRLSQKNGNLARHMMIHIAEKQYECSQCDKDFVKKSYLANHMRTRTGEKSYQCSQCDKAFTEIGNLVRHMVIHTGEEP